MASIYEKFLSDITKKPLIILKENSKNLRYGGYKKVKNGWIFSGENTKFISLGSFFITYEEIKKRWFSSTSIPLERKFVENLDREINIDNTLFGENPISGEILSSKTPFIDIGVPSSLKEGQTYIPEIIGS